jgi:DNA-directed RNA polymerase specialized sigma subunit
MKTEYLNNRHLQEVIFKFQKSKQDKVRFELIMEDVSSSVATRLRHKKEPNHNLHVYNLEYHQASLEFANSQKELAHAFYILSEHLVRYAKDIIVDSDDAIQEGVMICFEKIDRFNPAKGKAFNYMTTCILNHFRQIYRTSRNYKLLKEKYRDFMAAKYSNVIIKNGREIHIGDSYD